MRPTVRSAAFLCGSGLVLLVGTCIIPYAFPPNMFVKGASFEVGFNNAVAYMWYVCFLWGPALALMSLLPDPSVRTDPEETARINFWPTAVVWAALLLHAALFGALYFYKGQFVFAEALYFQTLLHRMTLGDMPYLDFSFYYGPAMLYPGYVLTKVLSVEAAYGAYFVVTYLAGLYLLYLVVQAALGERAAVHRWFLFFAIAFFNPWTGLNVTFLRYLLPIASVLVALAYFKIGTLRGLFGAGTLLAFTMLYTFEAGSVAAATIVVLALTPSFLYWLSRRLNWLSWAGIGALVLPEHVGSNDTNGWRPTSQTAFLRRVLSLLGLVLILCTLVFLSIDPSGQALRLYPAIALSYSAGAHNVPIYTNLPMLALVGLTVCALAFLLKVARYGGVSRHYDLVIGGVAVVLLMERGAFGVAEPTHFAYYGMPLFLSCLFLVRWVGNRKVAEVGLAVVLGVGIALPLQYYHATLVTPFLEGRRILRASAVDAERSMERKGVIQQTLTTVVQRLGNDRPYLMYRLDYYSFPIYRKLGLKYPTYFTMLSNARTYDDMRLVLEQIRDNRAVIVGRRQDLFPDQSLTREPEHTNVLDWISGAHTAGSYLSTQMLRSEDRLTQPFRDFVQASYVVVLEINGIIALQPMDRGTTMKCEGCKPMAALRNIE